MKNIEKYLSLLTGQVDGLLLTSRYSRYYGAEFDIAEGVHPIVPVMLYDAKVAQEFAARMLEKGVYVVGFCYPVVPQGKARIRTQVSAAHSREDLDFALRCFKEVRDEMGL